MDKVARTGVRADNKCKLIIKNETDVLHLMAPKEELSSPSHHREWMSGTAGSSKQPEQKVKSRRRRTKSEGSVSNLTLAIVDYQNSIKSSNNLKPEMQRFNLFLESRQLNSVKPRSKGNVESHLAAFITYTTNLAERADYLLEGKDKVIEGKDKVIEGKDKEIEGKEKEIDYLKEKVTKLEQDQQQALFGNIGGSISGLIPSPLFGQQRASPPTAPDGQQQA